MATVNIQGLDKAALLAALYNGSAPMGMGFLQACPGPMTHEQATDLLKAGDDSSRMFPTIGRGRKLYFDYVYGRPLKVDIGGDELETAFYDRDNGQGSGARIVAELRKLATQDAPSTEMI